MYKIVITVCFSLSIFFLLLAVAMFFLLDISEAYRTLYGKVKKNKKERTGTDGQNAPSGGLVGQIYSNMGEATDNLSGVGNASAGTTVLKAKPIAAPVAQRENIAPKVVNTTLDLGNGYALVREITLVQSEQVIS